MEELFQQIADSAALGMEVIASAVVSTGALTAGWRLLQSALHFGHPPPGRKEIWRHFGMSLLLGLEFMLAADIVRTAISPSWQQIGELAAIAAIRTFLSYFLEADLERAGRTADRGSRIEDRGTTQS